MLELESAVDQNAGLETSGVEKQRLAHFSEDEPNREPRCGENRWPLERSGEHTSELPLGHGAGRRNVDGARDVLREETPQHADLVGQRDPTPVLPTAAQRPCSPELGDQHQPAEGRGLGPKDQRGPGVADPHTEFVERLRRPFPSNHQVGEERRAGRRRLGEDLVPPIPVDAHRRTAQEHRWPVGGRQALDRRDQEFGGTDAGVGQAALLRRRPPPCDRFAREVDDGIGTSERSWVERARADIPHHPIGPRGARQSDHVVAVIPQRGSERAPDQTRHTCDHDLHQMRVWQGAGPIVGPRRTIPRQDEAMKAVVMRGGALEVDDVALPDPLEHQVVIDTLACGICGTDLHCLRHADQFVETSREGGMDVFVFDTSADIVMGHELAGRVARPAADGTGPAEGTGVAVMPGLTAPGQPVMALGYSNSHPGGYAEQFVADATGCIPIPEHLDPTRAALTEPLAVGLHAVNAGGTEMPGGAMVLGCGPVGLTVVAWLAARGVSPIVAADFSPARRALAATMGADVVTDPASIPAVDAWRDAGGTDATPPVVFECVGVPGMIDQAITMAPRNTTLVVVGLCMETDTFRPTMAINRHVSLHFVLGWGRREFQESLDAIASGAIDVEPLITGQVDLDGVPDAFDELARPQEHAKILVIPGGGT